MLGNSQKLYDKRDKLGAKERYNRGIKEYLEYLNSPLTRGQRRAYKRMIDKYKKTGYLPKELRDILEDK